jgi:D-galactarolactone cycloisomerase
MRITDVRSLILQCPLEPRLGYSQAWIPARTAHLVEVETDAGIVGIGEAFGGGNVAIANKAIVEHVLRPMLLGQNPADVEVLWHRMYNTLRDHGQKGMPLQAISGVDIALWDILGKEAGKPLYQLLGGRFRERITPYGYGMLFRDVPDLPADFAREAADIVALGFTAVKMKIGISPRDDLRLVKAVREAIGPDVRLMVDANHAYTATEAIPLGRKFEELDVFWFEEPVAPEDYEGYHEVKTALDLAIAGGEAEFSRWGFRELIGRRCVDILQPEVAGMGGITEFRKVVALATTWGIPIVPHVFGSAVLIAADMHLVASLPDQPGSLNPVQPMLEYDTTPNPLRTDLLREPLPVLAELRRSGGTIPVPEGPGLGVDLDPAVVRRYRVG